MGGGDGEGRLGGGGAGLAYIKGAMVWLRLRVVVGVVAAVLLGLFGRAAQVQWRQHDYWVEQAERRLEQVELVETSRGRILDYKGRELAVDAPCVDAVVDYRVIRQPVDEKWVKDVARGRLRRKLGEDYLKAPRDQQKRLIEQQMTQVRADIDQMWLILGEKALTGMSEDQVEERRRQVVRKVQMQKRYLTYAGFLRAEKTKSGKAPPWWQGWLSEQETGDSLLDSYDLTVGEEVQSHVILPAINSEVANYLGKNAEKFPGLSLRPGLHRVYPYGEAGCHVIGYMTPASAEDLKQDAEREDPLRKYWPFDGVGRAGVEKMCEESLRGTRGQWRKTVGQEAAVSTAAVAGKDVRLSIDIELQKKIEQAFVHRKTRDGKNEDDLYHGAAVVIDVPTGQVRALISYPTYDVNRVNELLGPMLIDEINKPMLNRATMAQLEPGSTVKPMVGIAGITDQVVGIHEGIECTGYFRYNGLLYRTGGRCWTVQALAALGLPAGHHPSHVGIYGNPDGSLVFADALERSCNVWPETVGERLGWLRLKGWYGRFGLGRPTGLGLPEASGRLPDPVRTRDVFNATRFAAMGQGIGATPIQMVNVAATIARNGLWIRPTLVAEGSEGAEGAGGSEEDRRQLPVDPAAVAEARKGMFNVVNGESGTGKVLRRAEVMVAGKTGSAQAAIYRVLERDEAGRVVMENGQKKRRVVKPSTATWSNPEAPWYRNTGTEEKPEYTHAWFMGFAPAERPQIAFVVMVEYGGSGGKVAGPIANAVLDAAEEEGYLAKSASRP